MSTYDSGDTYDSGTAYDFPSSVSNPVITGVYGSPTSTPSGNIITIVVPNDTVELQVPFEINPTGAVDVTTDEVVKAINHILGVAFTQPGERVMRPTFGVGIQRLVFQNNARAQFAAAAAAMQSAYRASDGGLMSTSVTVQQAYDDTWNFNVSFTLNQSPIVHQAVFDYKGNLVGYS